MSIGFTYANDKISKSTQTSISEHMQLESSDLSKNLGENDQPVSYTSSLKKKTASVTSEAPSISIALPLPTMSMAFFINSISSALEEVLTIKAANQISDANLQQSSIKTILKMTRDKITLSDRANRLMVQNLEKSITTMKIMRILLYTVMIEMIILVAVIAAILIICSGGTASVLIVPAAIMLITLIISTVTTITITEETRKGKMHLNANQSMWLMVGMVLVQAIGIILSAGALLAIEMAIQAIVFFILMQAIQATAQLVATAVSSGAAQALAEGRAQRRYEKSDEKKEIENKHQSLTATNAAKEKAGSITAAQAKENNIRESTRYASADSSAKKSWMRTEVANQSKQLEIVNWVVMALSLGLALLGGAASMGMLGATLANAMNSMADAAMSSLGQQLISILNSLSVVISIGQSLVEGAMTIETEVQKQIYLEKALAIQNMLNNLDAFKTLLLSIKNNLEASSKQSLESISKVVAALANVLSSTFRIVSDFAG